MRDEICSANMTPDERAANVYAALGSAETPVTLIADAIREAVTEERERCATAAEAEREPEEAMPWRYWLRALLRPERVARRVMWAVRTSIAARIRMRGSV
jgi:hypothetical protein